MRSTHRERVEFFFFFFFLGDFETETRAAVCGALTRRGFDCFGADRGGGEDVGRDARETVSRAGREGETVGEETRGRREGWRGSRGEGFNEEESGER